MKTRTRRIWTVIALVLFFHTANTSALGQGAGGLYVSISEERTEHSRDSSSISRTIKIEGHALVYEETRRRRKPLHKEYRLTDEEVGRLKRLIVEKRLLTSRTVEHPEGTGPHTSILLSLELKLNRKTSLIKISGAANSKELKEDGAYQNANALLEGIIEMTEAQDELKPR